MKKWYQKLGHPWAKSAAGFTLVELVVVIAILGVLGGVGTVAYSGYMKSAQKKADQTLVANIVRAIEMGTQSTMFTHDDSFKMGELSYPVGFVALSDTGVQVVTSETKMKENEVKEAGACVFETVENVLIETMGTYETTCAKYESKPIVTNVTTGTITYCTTHSSAAPNVVDATGKYTHGYTHKANMLGCLLSGHKLTAQETAYPSGAKRVNNLSSLEQLKGNNLCELAYAYQYDSYDSSTTNIAPRTSGTLYDSIAAAFGDVSQLKLTYDGWVSDEGVNYATFYTSAPAVMDDIEELSGLLVTAYEGLELIGQGDKLGLSQGYHNDEDVLVNVAKVVAQTHSTEDAWMQQWNAASGKTWDSWGFGLSGRENYSAARMGYNTAFASYMDAHGMSAYSDKIRNFYSQELAGVGMPGLICTDAFTDADSPLKGKINNEEAFNKIAALYETYKTSAACEENGRVFYRTLKTFNQTSDMAQKQVENGEYDNIYEYYNGYVDEIAGLYSKAQEASAGGIVIIATVEGGDVKCVVSPASADLRTQ